MICQHLALNDQSGAKAGIWWSLTVNWPCVYIKALWQVGLVGSPVLIFMDPTGAIKFLMNCEELDFNSGFAVTGFPDHKNGSNFWKKGKKKLLLQTVCVEYQLGLLLLNMTNHNNHDNTATFCEIRNSVKILSGLVSHWVSTVYGFWWNIICSNCSGLCCGWILDYNLCEKIWQYRCVHYKAHFNVLFGTWKWIYS